MYTKFCPSQDLAQHFQEIGFRTSSILNLPTDPDCIRQARYVAENMTGDHAWKVQNLEMIPAILERIPLAFWEAGLTGVPEFKGLPFAEEAYVNYDGFLNEQVCLLFSHKFMYIQAHIHQTNILMEIHSK